MMFIVNLQLKICDFTVYLQKTYNSTIQNWMPKHQIVIYELHERNPRVNVGVDYAIYAITEVIIWQCDILYDDAELQAITLQLL